MRHVWLIRHAKSSWSDTGVRDHDRPLNGRGRRDGPRMAAWLAAQKHPATWLWTSTARRARATAEFVRQGFGDDCRAVEEPALYGAGPEQIVAVLRATPDDVDSAAVVAHNPGMTALVNLMHGKTAIDNLPTFGVALFELDCDWPDVRFSGRLLELMSPKRLPGD